MNEVQTCSMCVRRQRTHMQSLPARLLNMVSTVHQHTERAKLLLVVCACPNEWDETSRIPFCKLEPDTQFSLT